MDEKERNTIKDKLSNLEQRCNNIFFSNPGCSKEELNELFLDVINTFVKETKSILREGSEEDRREKCELVDETETRIKNTIQNKYHLHEEDENRKEDSREKQILLEIASFSEIKRYINGETDTDQK